MTVPQIRLSIISYCSPAVLLLRMLETAHRIPSAGDLATIAKFGIYASYDNHYIINSLSISIMSLFTIRNLFDNTI